MFLQRFTRMITRSAPVFYSQRMKSEYTNSETLGDDVAENLRKAASGNVSAQLYLANYYSTGGERRDVEKAASYLQQAIAAGSSKAKVILASTLLNTLEHLEKEPQNERIKQAIDLLHEAAEQEDPVALQKLGVFHYKGSYVDKDIPKAIDLLTKSSSMNTESKFELGKIFLEENKIAEGLACLQEAMKLGSIQASEHYYDFLYRRAVASGNEEIQKYVDYLLQGVKKEDPLSMHFLGLLYLQHGQSFQKTMDDAVELIAKASKNGFVPSHCTLGDLHRTGVINKGEPSFKEAIQCYEMAVKAEYGAGYYSLGKCYLDGLGVPRDYVKAEELFRSAIASGYLKAHTKLGVMHYEGLGLTKNQNAAISHFQKACAEGDAEGMYRFGYHLGNIGNVQEAAFYLEAASSQIPEAGMSLSLMYLSGIGSLEQDIPKALQFLEQSASLGYLPAICKLGLLYFEGNIVSKDLKKAEAYWKLGCDRNDPQSFHNVAMLMVHQNRVSEAVDYLNKAAQNGLPESQVKLGTMLLYGDNITEDPIKGVDLLEKAAESGNFIAQIELGRYYTEGVKIPVDITKAVKHFTRAAEKDPSIFHIIGSLYEKFGDTQAAFESFSQGAQKGDDLCQVSVANSYYNGNGVEIDFSQAASWFEKASKTNINAMYNLGLMIFVGEGQEKDEKKGLELMQGAAAQGSVAAQTNLGIIFWSGTENLKSDPLVAIMWWEKAVAQRDPVAMYYLGNALVSRADSPEDIERGNSLLEESKKLGCVEK